MEMEKRQHLDRHIRQAAGFRADDNAENEAGIARFEGVLSSENPVKTMIFDPERGCPEVVEQILLHNADSVDLSRMAGGINLLLGHNHWDDASIVGAIDKADIDGAELRGVIRVDTDSPEGQRLANQWRKQIGMTLSIGFKVLDAELRDMGEGNIRRQIVKRWQLVEISRVPIPADPFAAIGRDYCGGMGLAKEQADVYIRALSPGIADQTHKGAESREMDPEPNKNKSQAGDSVESRAKQEAAISAAVGEALERRKGLEREIDDFASLVSTDGEKMRSFAAEARRKAMSGDIPDAAGFRASVLEERERIRKTQADGQMPSDERTILKDGDNEIDGERMNPRGSASGDFGSGDLADEIMAIEKSGQRAYSLGHAYLAAMNGESERAKKEFGVEIEVGRALDQLTPDNAGVGAGVSIPRSAIYGGMGFGNGLRQLKDLYARAQVAGVDASGGHAVNEIIDARLWRNFLYNLPVLERMGVSMLGGLMADVRAVSMTAGLGASAFAETGSITVTDPTYASKTYAPRRIGGHTQHSRRFDIQNALSLVPLLRADLATALRSEEDKQCLVGDGTGENLTGLALTTGRGVINPALTSGGDAVAANTSGPMRWADLIKVSEAFGVANLNDSGMRGFVFAPTTLTSFKKRAKIENIGLNGYGQGLILDSPSMHADVAMGARGEIDMMPVHVSNQLRSNRTKGTLAALREGLALEPAHIFGLRWGGGIRLVQDELTKADQGITRLIVEDYINIAVVRPAAVQHLDAIAA